ncbi:MAG: hypothetical protein IPH28_20015 [Cytophagaceae bacterium]|nr:hypothetical protein [Cytophagaceae bacterium]
MLTAGYSNTLKLENKENNKGLMGGYRLEWKKGQQEYSLHIIIIRGLFRVCSKACNMAIMSFQLVEKHGDFICFLNPLSEIPTLSLMKLFLYIRIQYQ